MVQILKIWKCMRKCLVASLLIIPYQVNAQTVLSGNYSAVLTNLYSLL